MAQIKAISSRDPQRVLRVSAGDAIIAGVQQDVQAPKVSKSAYTDGAINCDFLRSCDSAGNGGGATDNCEVVR